MSLDSHKRFDNILGRDEIDIDFIRNGSSSPNSKSSLGSNSNSPVKHNYNNYAAFDDDEIEGIILFFQLPHYLIVLL